MERRHVRAISFPGEMQNESRRGAGGLGRRKVLVGAAMSPTNPWRLRVAVDELGALARNTATMVVPRLDSTGHVHGLSEDECLFGLAAYLGSGLASSFISDAVQTRKIGAPQIRALPVPESGVLRDLATLGSKLVEAATSNDVQQVASLRAELERYVWDWSAVPDDTRSLMLQRLQGGSGAHESDPMPVNGELWTRPGEVLSVDPDGFLNIYVEGVTGDSGSRVRLPMRFPGALLAQGAPFFAHMATGEDLATAEYTFDPADHATDDEVYASLLSASRRLTV